MALAAVVLAVQPALMAQQEARLHSQFHGQMFPHYRFIMAAYFSQILGLLLAAVGFWIASNARRSVDEPNEVESVTV